MNNINDTCKETLALLSYFNSDFIQKIPSKVLKGISDLAADSKLDFYIDKEKDLEGQNISEESKDLISLIYYNYAISENEKNKLLKLWGQNESEYQEELREKYDLDKVFQIKNITKIESETQVQQNLELLQYKKKNIFDKIKSFLKKLLK